MRKHCSITINEMAKDLLITESVEMGERVGSYVSENELISTVITELYEHKKNYRGLLALVEAKIIARVEKQSWDRYHRNIRLKKSGHKK